MTEHSVKLDSAEKIIACCVGLLRGQRFRLVPTERQLADRKLPRIHASELNELRLQVQNRLDPLGEAYCATRSVEDIREAGAIYTPSHIVDSMLSWAYSLNHNPSRIVDPGAGTGRFLLNAGERFPAAALIGVEYDPLAALILRANAAVLGLLPRLHVAVSDYRSFTLVPTQGNTLFIGNPPYTRHHDIPERWKEWFSALAEHYGAPASQLAGLHIHFFAKTLQLARNGDYGLFITAAEWLDVNYGKVLRHMLLNGLGGSAIHVLSPKSKPFGEIQTTGAITCFEVGSKHKKLKFRSVRSSVSLGDLTRGGREISKTTLTDSSKWSVFIKRSSNTIVDPIRLGDLFDVHRGQVTGCNYAFLADNYPEELPESVLFPAITRAKELFDKDTILDSIVGLRKIIDLPSNIEILSKLNRSAVTKYIDWAIGQKADKSYIAKHRKPWWSVKLKEPAPILCTYMARRSPRFIRNLCSARHINVAHGLYPAADITEKEMMLLIKWLNQNVSQQMGRTYAGGLTKFEPGEVSSIKIPSIAALVETQR